MEHANYDPKVHGELMHVRMGERSGLLQGSYVLVGMFALVLALFVTLGFINEDFQWIPIAVIGGFLVLIIAMTVATNWRRVGRDRRIRRFKDAVGRDGKVTTGVTTDVSYGALGRNLAGSSYRYSLHVNFTFLDEDGTAREGRMTMMASLLSQDAIDNLSNIGGEFWGNMNWYAFNTKKRDKDKFRDRDVLIAYTDEGAEILGFL